MSEMAPAHLRGRLSGINQTMIVSGMLLSYIVDFLLKDLPETMAWRLMLGLAAVPAIISSSASCACRNPRVPRQPRFVDQARRVLGYIRKNDKEVEAELADIQNTAASEAQAQSKTTFATLLSDQVPLPRDGWCRRCSFQQFQGANAIFYYIPLIVEKATGQAASSQLMWPIIQGILLVLGSLIFLVIADKFKPPHAADGWRNDHGPLVHPAGCHQQHHPGC